VISRLRPDILTGILAWNIVALLLVLTTAAAQTPSAPQGSAAKKDYALIYGTVWSPDDHPVAGVPIKIRKASDKKAKWEIVSDRNGEFAQRVPVGAQDYAVQADVKTPKGQPKPETTVHIDDNERKDISLHLSK
jgi:hypothetical protein